MKSSPHARNRGFTLMELLVVITIIAVLAGLAIPTMALVAEKAKEAQARAGVHGLQIAVTSFQSEYNRLPRPGGGTGPGEDTRFDTDSSNELIRILLGKDTLRNPKEIPFYSAPMAKNEANGLITSGSDAYEVVDPWSTPGARQYYHVVLDFNDDHRIENPVRKEAAKFSPAFIAAQPADLVTEVAVYCDGNPRKASSSRKAITSW